MTAEWKEEPQEKGHVDLYVQGRAIVCRVEGLGTIVVVDGQTVHARQLELTVENGKLVAEAAMAENDKAAAAAWEEGEA